MLSFADYDNLILSVARTLARSDLNSDIAGWIWLTECDIQRRTHMRLNDATATGTVPASQDYLQLPADFVEFVHLEWTGNNLPQTYVSSWQNNERLRKLGASSSSSSLARAVTVHGDRAYIAPSPGDLAYTLYYKSGVHHMGPSVPSNRILQLYPDLLLYGALTHSAPFLGDDERIPVWSSFFEARVKDAAQQEWRSRTGSGPLVMRPDFQVY